MNRYGTRATERDSDGFGGDFADLEWEQELMETNRRSRASRRRPFNLTSHIEDVMRSSW